MLSTTERKNGQNICFIHCSDAHQIKLFQTELKFSDVEIVLNISKISKS